MVLILRGIKFYTCEYMYLYMYITYKVNIHVGYFWIDSRGKNKTKCTQKRY